MADIASKQKALLAAGKKLDATDHSKAQCLIFSTPATAAWAQNDTIGAGQVIPRGSRLLPSYVSFGAFGSSVTMDVGLRSFADGSEIDLDGLGDGIDVSSAGFATLNSGVLISAGAYPDVLAKDAEPVATLLSANPTDNVQATFYIWYLPPG